MGPGWRGQGVPRVRFYHQEENAKTKLNYLVSLGWFTSAQGLQIVSMKMQQFYAAGVYETLNNIQGL